MAWSSGESIAGAADGQIAWRSGTRGDGITPAEAADRLVERRLADAAA